MGMEYLVDVLVATFNGEKYIACQLDSLLQQKGVGIRILIHDDGSVDETCRIIEDYANRYSDRIIYLSDGVVLGGAKGNFNYLLGCSSAPYVMFCDQDDFWLPYKVSETLGLMTQVESVNQGFPVLIHADLTVVDEGMRTVGSSYFDYAGIPRCINDLSELLVQNNVTGCTVMLNRVAVDLIFPMPYEAVMHDWWSACRVLSENGVVALLDKPLVLYRQHGSNSIGARKFDFKYILNILCRPRIVLQTLNSTLRQARLFRPGLSFVSLVVGKIRVVIRRLLRTVNNVLFGLR